MRKTFSIILLIILSITLTGCGGSRSGKQSLSDAVYEVKIQESVQSAELIDAFAKNGNQYFNFLYPGSVYVGFFYEGNLDSLDQVDGDMQMTFRGMDTTSLVNSPVELIAEYTSSNRHVAYYVLDSSEEPNGNTTQVTSARFSELVEKLEGYLGNLGVSSGYIEMTDYALDGYWMIYHFPAKGKNADVQLKIDSVTLELLEYNQNP